MTLVKNCDPCRNATSPSGAGVPARVLRPHRAAARAILLFTGGVALFTTGCGGPFWYVFPEEGVKQAQKDGKPMLLYFKAWDSTQHRNMKRDVLEHADVKRELTGMVNIEIDMMVTDYVRKYRVQAAQVCVVCSPDGREVSRMFVNPVPEPGKFAEWLKKAKADAKPKTTSGPK